MTSPFLHFHNIPLFPAPWVAFLTLVIAILVFRYCNDLDSSFFSLCTVCFSYLLIGLTFYFNKHFFADLYDNDREMFTTFFHVLFLYEKVIAIFMVNLFVNAITMPTPGGPAQVSLPVKITIKFCLFAFIVIFSGSPPGCMIPGCRVRGFTFLTNLHHKGWLHRPKR